MIVTYESYIRLFLDQQGRILGGGFGGRPPPPRVTKGAPKIRKRKGKEEREKRKEEKKGGEKGEKIRLINLKNERGTIQRQI